jgi:hypothetical protein
MAKRKFFATTVVGKAVNIDNDVEFGESPFKVRNVSVKSYDEEGNPTKIKEPTAEQLANEDIRVFMMLDVQNVDDLLIVDMAVANRPIDGVSFQDVINRAADGSFTLKDGACIARVGKTFVFSLN